MIKQIPVKKRELSETVYKWLILAGNNLQRNFCKKEITSHDDYPAITAVTDFLDEGKMNYNAVQADVSWIHEFNYPLLAHIKEEDVEYLDIIKDVGEWDRKQNITSYWTGIVIYPGKNAKWRNVENDIAVKKEQAEKSLLLLWSLVATAVFVVSIIVHPSFFYNAFGFLSFAGIIFSLGAFSSQLGVQSSPVKHLCGVISQGGCEKVLKSRIAEGILGITPADLSLLYFTTQFIVYVTSVWQPAFFTLLPFLSVAGIAIACVSIYSQAFLIKQWCALCIGMAAILALQGVQSFFLIRILYPASVFFFSLILFSLSLILFPVKLLVKNILSAGPRLSELKKWKSNFDLFVLQLKNGKTVDTTVWENDLLIGDVHSPVLITVVCNPFCHPCAAAHKQLEEMLNHFQGKIAVQLRLLCNPEIEKDKRTAAVRSLLQKALQINNDELQCMLADWFEWMDHEKWNHKWKPDERLGVDHLVNKHRAWIKEAGVNHTPAFFINGRVLPGRYGLNEVEKLVPQLAEAFCDNNIIQSPV